MMCPRDQALWWLLLWKFPESWRTRPVVGEIQIFRGQATGGGLIIMQISQVNLMVLLKLG